MFNGVFALLERSLRVDARAWSPHLARLALIGSIYFSLCFTLAISFTIGAPGLLFFQVTSYLDATFMTLLGIGFFSTSITEEKEEDTLGLMLMAGISPLGILAGKSGGRLWQALLLIAVQYPFVLLAVTMGGVMGTQIWSVTIALLSYMVFLAGFGLLCSTLAPRSQSAVAWMVMGVVLYFVGPTIAAQYSHDHAVWALKQGAGVPSVWWAIVGGIAEICVFVQLSTILSTGFTGSWLSVQVLTNVLAGAVCAGLSWAFFGIATRNPTTATTSRGLVARFRKLSPFHAGRSWKNPLLWKDFQFITGGVGMLLVRSAYYSGLGILTLHFEAGGPGNNNPSEWFGLTMAAMWLSVPIDAARLIARSNQDEIRNQTLATLTMLPRSSIGIVYSKTAGALLGWLPGPVIALTVTLISPSLRKALGEAFTQEWGFLMLSMLILYFALIPHFASLFSMYVRWGAVCLAIGATIGVYFGLMMSIQLVVMFLFWGVNAAEPELLLFAVVSAALLALCVICHIGVILRFQALAAK